VIGGSAKPAIDQRRPRPAKREEREREKRVVGREETKKKGCIPVDDWQKKKDGGVA